MGIFLTSLKPVSFSRITLLHIIIKYLFNNSVGQIAVFSSVNELFLRRKHGSVRTYNYAPTSVHSTAVDVYESKESYVYGTVHHLYS